jgi:SWI/SNF related-matrix-associated actin-dependent regulator of chromatin subfamily C
MGSKEQKLQFETDDEVTDESRAENSKRLRLTPLADASNPIMAQVCIFVFTLVANSLDWYSS